MKHAFRNAGLAKPKAKKKGEDIEPDKLVETTKCRQYVKNHSAVLEYYQEGRIQR
jgi:hypothetical protein